MELIKFNSLDGTELNGVFTHQKSDTELRGCFLLMHGIPSEKNEWGFYSDMAEYLSENGYASFRFDFRYNGDNNGDGTMLSLSINGMLLDIEAAFQIITAKVNCNYYVVGTSCGGGVTVKWLNVFNHNIKQCFLMAPVLDYAYEVTGKKQELFLSNSPQEILNSLLENGYLNDDIHYGKTFFDDSLIFDGAKELNNCNIPISFFQGDSDSVVPYSLTKQIIHKSEKSFPFHTIKNADHGFAVLGDDDLTAPGTKQNHYTVYSLIISEIEHYD